MDDRRLRIGVTTRVVTPAAYAEPRDALAQDWSRFLAQALPEAAWMALPNIGPDKIVDYCARWGINALILSGGEDIGVSPLRDETEHALLSWADSVGAPVLGVCRGLQMMTVWAGGNLVPVEGHVVNRHGLAGEIAHEVNSYHAKGLRDCPPGFSVLASAPDGTIEAIRHEHLPWEGWMWHPEREETFSPDDIGRLREIVR